MSISKWDLMAPYPRLTSIDLASPTVNTYNSFEIGLMYAGGVKTLLRRALYAFNLTAPPFSGSPLVGGELIADAYIEARAGIPLGASNQPAYIQRVTRYDWIKTEATWNIYRAANNWTAGGGDVDTVTPAQVSWSTPTAAGAITITGLLAFANDAILYRSGIVNLLARLVAEADDGIQRYTSLADVFFCLDYQDGDAPVPRQGPTVGRLARMPQYGHILGQRREGATIRQLRGARQGLEEGTRARELVGA